MLSWAASVGEITRGIERTRIGVEQVKPGSSLSRGKQTVTP